PGGSTHNVTTSRLEWNLYVATADRGPKRYKAQSFLRFALASCAHRTASQLAEKSTNREFRCYHPKSCVGRIRVNIARDRASQPTFIKCYAKGIALWKVCLLISSPRHTTSSAGIHLANE